MDTYDTTLFETKLNALLEQRTAEVAGIVDERQTKRETNKALKAKKTEDASASASASATT